jgi:hypothetical protein
VVAAGVISAAGVRVVVVVFVAGVVEDSLVVAVAVTVAEAVVRRFWLMKARK